MRSTLAQGCGLLLRLLEPGMLRLRRFAFEARARAQIRGFVAAGVQFIGPIAVEGTGNIQIGRGTRIGRRVFFETQGAGTIEIGDQVTINDGVTIVAYERVHIGDFAMVGELTSIRDANHGLTQGIDIRTQPHLAAPVNIGRDAWIGRGAYIGKGARVGDGAVVGANSVVTRDVAPDAIVAGAPARAIGVRPHKGSNQ